MTSLILLLLFGGTPDKVQFGLTPDERAVLEKYTDDKLLLSEIDALCMFIDTTTFIRGLRGITGEEVYQGLPHDPRLHPPLHTHDEYIPEHYDLNQLLPKGYFDPPQEDFSPAPSDDMPAPVVVQAATKPVDNSGFSFGMGAGIALIIVAVGMLYRAVFT